MQAMPQEEVCEFLMDREDWRFVRIIIALLCMGVMIICIPFVCVCESEKCSNGSPRL